MYAILRFTKTNGYLPTAPAWPFSAAIISGVFPELSAAFTCALWLKRSCRHSTWSAKAAAWSGVLKWESPIIALEHEGISKILIALFI